MTSDSDVAVNKCSALFRVWLFSGDNSMSLSEKVCKTNCYKDTTIESPTYLVTFTQSTESHFQYTSNFQI